MSRGSGRSHSSHRKRRHRSRHRRTESGSENESCRRSFSGHRKSTGSMELLDPNRDWLDTEHRRNEDSELKSSNKNDSENYQNNRRHRKNRYILQC